MNSTTKVLIEVERERTRQDAKWGPQNHRDLPDRWREWGWGREQVAQILVVPTAKEAKDNCDYESDVLQSPTWSHILTEEHAEAIEQAALGDRAKLREELIQVAAVAVAWIEAIDRRTKENA